MTGLILTRPNQAGGGGIENAFETLVLDSGTLTATGADTLIIAGGTAITTSGGTSPKTITISVIPEEINLGDLGDVDSESIADGYVLVYRSGSPSGWVAEPSTSTDEFVRVSGTDTTTGHLDAKLAAGTNIVFSTLNPSGHEQIEISALLSLDDISNVEVPTPSVGDVLVYAGGSPANWTNIPITAFNQNLWETVVADTGSTTADTTTDTLTISGGTAINTSITGDTVTIDVNPADINLDNLGDVYVPTPSDGDVLVYRSGSPSGWINEPSTATDEFVKVSGTDTTTGHLDAKLAAGIGIDLNLLNGGSNEQFEIELNASLGQLNDVALGSPVSTGYLLGYNGADWVPINPADVDTTVSLVAGPGIEIITSGSPETKTINLDVCSLPPGGSPSTLDVNDTVAVCDGTSTLRYTIAQLGDVLNITTLEVFADMREPTGHVNRTDSTVSWSAGTRTFTIQPTTTSFRYYIHGVPYDITVAKSITLPNATGQYFIYFDTDEELHFQSTFSEALLLDVAYTANIIWNATPATGTNNTIYFGDERHGINMDGQSHLHMHISFGTQFIRGFALSGLNPDVGTPTDTDVQFAVENGVIRDEDLEWYIRDESSPAQTPYDLIQDLNPTAQIPVLFRNTGGSDWNITTPSSFPFIYSDGIVFTGGSGLPPYNAESGGSWSLQEVSNNSYFLVHYLATNDRNNPIVAIQGIANYGNRPAGQDQAQAELGQLSGLPFEEFVPIATIIYEARLSYGNTPQVRVVSTSDGAPYVDWRSLTFSSTTGGGGVSSHSSLSNLTSDDHPQYTTNAYDGITDGTNTENATGRNNTIKFEGTGGVNVTVGQTGSPVVDTVTIGIAGSPELELTTINGQPMLTYVDAVRSKRLSIAEQALAFSENRLTENDWLDIGNAVDGDSGYITDFDGTIVFATGHCEETTTNTKNIHIFVNGTDQGSIGSLTGGTDVSFINTTLNIDFARGDKIRLQAQQGSGGAIEDTVVKLTLKWRG